MTVFSIFDEDGRITQSNKVYDKADGYGDILNAQGLKFIVSENAHPVDLTAAHVKGGRLKMRQRMPVTLSANLIKAGEAFTLSGVPLGAAVTIATGDITIFSGPATSRVIEVQIPVPCVYRVHIERFPHLDFTCEVRAT